MTKGNLGRTKNKRLSRRKPTPQLESVNREDPMSDMSSLSHEYASSADFSRSLNGAVLLLKKQFTRGESVDEGDVQAAMSRLRATLSALIARLANAATGGEDVSI